MTDSNFALTCLVADTKLLGFSVEHSAVHPWDCQSHNDISPPRGGLNQSPPCRSASAHWGRDKRPLENEAYSSIRIWQAGYNVSSQCRLHQVSFFYSPRRSDYSRHCCPRRRSVHSKHYYCGRARSAVTSRSFNSPLKKAMPTGQAIQ